jgi:FHA domain-containing protein
MEPQYRHFALTTKATLKMAKDLLDRFFREGEGKTNRQIDVYFTLEDMGLTREKAEEGLEYLTSRGLINMFGTDIAFLTDLGVTAISQDKDIGKMSKAVRDFAAAKPAQAPSKAEPAPAAAASERAVTPVPRLPRSDMPRLTYTDADGVQHVMELGWECSIGRVEGNTIHLNDQRASKKHALIRFEDDHYVIKDLGAANGTLVNGSYIDEHILEHSDHILIGRTTLAYTCPAVIRPPAGQPAAAEPPAEAPAPDAAATPPPLPKPAETDRPRAKESGGQPIRVVKGRPESRRQSPPPPSARQEPPDLFDDLGEPGEPKIPPFPPPPAGSEDDLFAEPVRPARIRAEKDRGDDLFDTQPKRRSDEADLFADSGRGQSESDDLFSDLREHRPKPLPEDPGILEDALPIQPVDPLEPIYPLDPLAPMDEGPERATTTSDDDFAETIVRAKRPTTEPSIPISEDVLDSAVDAAIDRARGDWTEDRTPPDAALQNDAKLIANQPVLAGPTPPAIAKAPPGKKAGPAKAKKQIEEPPEEAATLMVAREDIAPMEEAEPRDNGAHRGARPAATLDPEADTNVELSDEPGFPKVAAAAAAFRSAEHSAPPSEDLHRWGEDPVPLGSHPSFAHARPGHSAGLRGEEIPDAPVGLPDQTMPPMEPAGREKRAPGPRADSHFHKLIQHLRGHVERADLPDRDQLLAALDLLDRHPYIRVALSLSEPDRAKF